MAVNCPPCKGPLPDEPLHQHLLHAHAYSYTCTRARASPHIASSTLSLTLPWLASLCPTARQPLPFHRGDAQEPTRSDAGRRRRRAQYALAGRRSLTGHLWQDSRHPKASSLPSCRKVCLQAYAAKCACRHTHIPHIHTPPHPLPPAPPVPVFARRTLRTGRATLCGRVDG